MISEITSNRLFGLVSRHSPHRAYVECNGFLKQIEAQQEIEISRGMRSIPSYAVPMEQGLLARICA